VIFKFRYLMLFLALTTAFAAQDTPFRIAIDATAVPVQVLVQDHLGRPLTGLTQDDFEVLEDGDPQHITHFAATGAPRSILLLFETSKRTEPYRSVMVSALNAFISRLRPQDRTAVAGFSDEWATFLDWRVLPIPSRQLDRYLEPRVANRTPVSPDSNLYGALETASQRFAAQRGLRAIVVMTDGHDTAFLEETLKRRSVPDMATDTRFQRLMKGAAAGVPVHFVLINRARSSNIPPDEMAEAFRNHPPELANAYFAATRQRLETLAAASGGRVFFPSSTADAVTFYDSISSELGLQYSLEYSPSNATADGLFRRINVRVRTPGARVIQSRSGYTPVVREET
jgi:Ca-activated chloride channel family protein